MVHLRPSPVSHEKVFLLCLLVEAAGSHSSMPGPCSQLLLCPTVRHQVRTLVNLAGRVRACSQSQQQSARMGPVIANGPSTGSQPSTFYPRNPQHLSPFKKNEFKVFEFSARLFFHSNIMIHTFNFKQHIPAFAA
jgi:hypothetical protein